MGSPESDHQISVVNLVIIGITLTAVEAVSPAVISQLLKGNTSTRMANNLWSLALTVAFTAFWGVVQVNRIGKGNHPIVKRLYFIPVTERES